MPPLGVNLIEGRLVTLSPGLSGCMCLQSQNSKGQGRLTQEGPAGTGQPSRARDRPPSQALPPPALPWIYLLSGPFKKETLFLSSRSSLVATVVTRWRHLIEETRQLRPGEKGRRRKSCLPALCPGLQWSLEPAGPGFACWVNQSCRSGFAPCSLNPRSPNSSQVDLWTVSCGRCQRVMD